MIRHPYRGQGPARHPFTTSTRAAIAVARIAVTSARSTSVDSREGRTGNITEVKHAVGGIVAWRRGYEYTPTGETGDDPDDPKTRTPDHDHDHDAHGNMNELPHISVLTWDEDDRLAYTDHGGGETWYVYDGSGQRVRKIHVNRQGLAGADQGISGSLSRLASHRFSRRATSG